MRRVPSSLDFPSDQLSMEQSQPAPDCLVVGRGVCPRIVALSGMSEPTVRLWPERMKRKASLASCGRPHPGKDGSMTGGLGAGSWPCPGRPRRGSSGWTHWSSDCWPGTLGREGIAVLTCSWLTWWRRRRLRPWQQGMFSSARTLGSEEKVTDIVGLYWTPRGRGRCSASMRKSQVQALDRTAAAAADDLQQAGEAYYDDCAMARPRCSRRLTWTPVRSLPLATVSTVPSSSSTSSTRSRTVQGPGDPCDPGHLLDASTAAVKEWLVAHPNFHFTLPVSGSSMNQVETLSASSTKAGQPPRISSWSRPDLIRRMDD